MSDFETVPVGTMARLGAAERERDALAAHFDRWMEWISRDVEDDESEWIDEGWIIANETPTTSLSRLKAEWQADALERFGDKWGWGEYRPDHKDIRQYAARLRHQSESTP